MIVNVDNTSSEDNMYAGNPAFDRVKSRKPPGIVLERKRERSGDRTSQGVWLPTVEMEGDGLLIAWYRSRTHRKPNITESFAKYTREAPVSHVATPWNSIQKIDTAQLTRAAVIAI